MKQNRYSNETKLKAVQSILQGDASVREGAERLGVSRHTLYYWLREFQKDPQNAFRKATVSYKPRSKGIVALECLKEGYDASECIVDESSSVQESMKSIDAIQRSCNRYKTALGIAMLVIVALVIGVCVGFFA